MPDNTLGCSLSNADYQRRLPEQSAAEQSDRTCHQNQCEAPPEEPGVPTCREERSVQAESVAAGYTPTRASSELAHKARARKKAHKASAHGAHKKRTEQKPTDTNAQRTMARYPGPYAGAGVTSSGDSVYAGVALVKGKKEEAAADLFSASAQVGAQTEAQVGMARVHIDLTRSGSVQGDLDAFTARAAEGIHNEDGSTGFNSSSSASFAKLGITGRIGGAEVHLAGSLGPESPVPSVHAGVRDPDHDGRYDVCAGIGAAGVDLSVCLPNLVRW